MVNGFIYAELLRQSKRIEKEELIEKIRKQREANEEILFDLYAKEEVYDKTDKYYKIHSSRLSRAAERVLGDGTLKDIWTLYETYEYSGWTDKTKILDIIEHFIMPFPELEKEFKSELRLCLIIGGII